MLLGSSEQIGELASQFEIIDRRWRIYRKRHSKRPPVSALLSTPPQLYNTYPQTENRDRNRFDADLYDALLENFMPPGFLLNERFELVYIFGGANRYLQLPEGRGSLNIIDLMRGNLRTAIRAALHRASKQNETVEYTGVRVDTWGDTGPVQERVHSVNEELYTVNSAYQYKINELTQLTNDLKNLQQSSEEDDVTFLESDQESWKGLLERDFADYDDTIHRMHTRRGDVRTIMWRSAPMLFREGTSARLL